MSTMWKSAKRFFGRMRLRRNNRVGPSGEDGLNPDPSYQLDILEYRKEMKAQSKRGVWGLTRRKKSKSKSEKPETAKNELEEIHRTRNVVDEKIGPKEVLDIDNDNSESDNITGKESPSIGVACVTPKDDNTESNDIEVEKITNENPRDGNKENDTVSAESSQHEDALPQAQTCLNEESPKPESINDENENELMEPEEKSPEVNCSDKILSDVDSDTRKSQSCPGCGSSHVPDKVPQSDFWDEMAEGYLFSSAEEEDEDEEMDGFSFYADDEEWEEKPADEELPRKESFEEKLTRLDYYVQNTVRWVSAMFTAFDFLSDFESDVFSGSEFGLKDLAAEMFHITDDPDPILLSMILNQETFSTTNLDNLQICEPKRSYTQVARSEEWTDDEYFESEPEESGSTTNRSEYSNLESKIPDKEILAAEVSEEENLNTEDIDPPEKQSAETAGFPSSIPEIGSISPGKTSNLPETTNRLGFAQKCIRWIARKVGRNRARVAPAELIGTQVLSSPCLNAKVKKGRPPSPSGSEKVKPSGKCQPDEVKEQNLGESPGTTVTMTETVSSPYRREQALRQKEDNTSDSLYGEVTVRKRTAKAGSQDWIRFPGRN